MFYMLDKEKNPVKARCMTEWALWFQHDYNVIVCKTLVGDAQVSTVFLGIDHNFLCNGGPPILFETMVFGGDFDEETHRYSTWKDAEEGHKLICYKVAAMMEAM